MLSENGNMLVRHNRPFLVVVIFWLALTVPAHASEFGLTFDRDNRTYRWNNFLQYTSAASPRLQVRARGDLAKILIKKAHGSTGSDRWQDNLNLSAGLDYQLNDWSAVGLDLSGERTSVNRGEIITRGSIVFSSLTVTPLPGASLEGALGGKLDQKEQSDLNSREDGLSYGLSGSWEPNISGTQTAFEVIFSGDRLNAGHNASRTLSAAIERPLLGGSQMTLSFDDRLDARTNLFGPADETVLKRQDRIYRAVNLAVETPLPLNHHLHMTLSSSDRRIEYSLPEGPDKGVAQQNSRKTTQGFAASLWGQPFGKWFLSSDFSFEQGQHDFGRDINDEDVEEIFLGARVSTGLSPRDSLEASGQVTRSSFDPPHPDNFNDRDSFTSALKLTYIRVFSEALRLTTEAVANLTHLVYLRSQRSANNNWTRNYGLYPTVRIRPWASLTIDQSFGISANYTEYDFEDLFTDIKSNIFRQARTTSEVSYRPGEELDLTLSYTYRAEDFGRLVNEDRWVEILSWDKSYQNFDLSVAYPLCCRLVIVPNLGYSHRREYEHHQGGRHFKSRLISKRIGLAGRLRLRPDNDMTFSVSRSVEDATDIPERTFDRLQVTIQQVF
jgi:hypothetical protein